MRVFVYFNLRKKCWSIKALEGPHKGRVFAHADMVRLRNCTFKVSEAGRQRVLRTKHKNVHAGVEGYVVEYVEHDDGLTAFLCHSMSKAFVSHTTVTYNPYKGPTFVCRNSGMTTLTAEYVLMDAPLREVRASNVTHYVPAFDMINKQEN